MKVQPYVEFTTQRGVRMIARYVPVGGRYGLNGRLTNDDKPMVEFYDTLHDHDDWMGFKGQFITRYYVSTLRERKGGNTDEPQAGIPIWGTGGICLDGGVPIWDIDPYSMCFVMGWLAGVESMLLLHSLEAEQ